MSNVNPIIHYKLVEQKSKEIRQVIDGMGMPDVLAVLGAVIINITQCLMSEHVPFPGRFIKKWLGRLCDDIDKIESQGVEYADEELAS